MDVFKLHRRLIDDYAEYIDGFINIQDDRISTYVNQQLKDGLLWPEPLLQLNPTFETAETVEELANEGYFHKDCAAIFRKGKTDKKRGETIRLFKHQREAIDAAQKGENYILTTGTGSGKSLTYFVPIVDYILKNGPGNGIKAIIVYPMNALVNSQFDALQDFLGTGLPDEISKVTFKRYTGQESDSQKMAVIENPPDILITNYMMLELIMTRNKEKKLVDHMKDLRFLVFDELHTYRGRQGADVALLIRRLRDRVNSRGTECHFPQCIGTSATLAGGGSYAQQQEKIAGVAELIFGTTFNPQYVIGETLLRTTKDDDFSNPDFIHKLTKRLTDERVQPPVQYDAFIEDPLSSWLETTFGLSREEESGRLIRAVPRSITGDDGAAADLSKLTGVATGRCADAIREGLLAGYKCSPNPKTGFKPFAFRLHQFISRSGAVHATLEEESKRAITVFAQLYMPGDRKRKLFPLVFCRECGQEFYKVIAKVSNGFLHQVMPDMEGMAGGDHSDDSEDSENNGFIKGYLYSNESNKWPEIDKDVLERLPDSWKETRKDKQRVKSHRKADVPSLHPLDTEGHREDSGMKWLFINHKFNFCPNCGIAYGKASEYAKLASLASEGRSTATTLMSLSVIKYLRQTADLPADARKLLSFTDNRQDAALQAGHLNDFVENGVLRSLLFKALETAGPDGLDYMSIPIKIMEVMEQELEDYASYELNTSGQREEVKQSMRRVLCYRILRDLKRAWRVNAPNLEKCGLLDIRCPDLKELCAIEKLWNQCSPPLRMATPETRETVAQVLLDHMRRNLAIEADEFKPEVLEQIVRKAKGILKEQFQLHEFSSFTRINPAGIFFPGSPLKHKTPYHYFMSGQSGFANYLGRENTFPGYGERLTRDERLALIEDLFRVLTRGGLLQEVENLNIKGQQVTGYRIKASVLRWHAGDGENPAFDPLRTPELPEHGGTVNRFFTDFYSRAADDYFKIYAREHTAQVDAKKREEREKEFKDAKLPILFCSPTMELGVDIKDLNVVNMRNIPPTPANYSQRSGRAGRSGQPALVFTYCSTGNSHDQYFFNRPTQMVAGQVSPPCLDLANEDMIRAHIHAVWLAESGMSLGQTLPDILDMTPDPGGRKPPAMGFLEEVRDCLADKRNRRKAMERADSILESIKPHMTAAHWYTPDWLDSVMTQLETAFESACTRWRHLYRSAWTQHFKQGEIIRDSTRKQKEKNRARFLMNEAKNQMDLLADPQEAAKADFNSYRYFASEGFLPGYNFPRLPVMAYLPGDMLKSGHVYGKRESYLSRPRFVGISEFAPHAVVYHEGSKYAITQVILPVGREEIGEQSVKCCSRCGYIHRVYQKAQYDVCENCGHSLPLPLKRLMKLENVSTRKAERITSDEEERQKRKYNIVTGFRFAGRDGRPLFRKSDVMVNDEPVAEIRYGAAAVILRMNLGRRNRENKINGFNIDPETGRWQSDTDDVKGERDTLDEINNTPGGLQRGIIPYVEDRRNCLVFTPVEPLEHAEAVSLQAALRKAIIVVYQLEDNELAVEPLPNPGKREHFLFYETAEGGAGVLRHLAEVPGAMAEVAQKALELCHFDPVTGNDTEIQKNKEEQCEAACYGCLMSYTNQGDHLELDRKLIVGWLNKLKNAQCSVSPGPTTREQHLQNLKNLSDSQLEKQWLDFIYKNGYNLPLDAQVLIESCRTRPDFRYHDGQVAVYIDGPHHDFPNRHRRGEEQRQCLDDMGIQVIRFAHYDDWDAVVKQYSFVFGKGRVS